MMNQVYSEYKSKVGSTSKTILKEEAPKILATQNGKIINGIVVAKNDSPIPNVEIYFKNLFYNKTYKTISMGDGRFSTNIQIPQGDYDIRLSKYGMKFHNYKINISNQKPPAYKFREK